MNFMLEIKKPKLLLVEGKEDVRFFKALLKHMLIDSVQVEETQGKTKLPNFIKTLPLAPNYENVESIAAVRDADDNPDGALQSVSNAFKSAGMNCPSGHGAFSEGRPKTGMFIMPDGVSSGMLEDLCLKAVLDDPAFRCVEDYFNCIAKAGVSEPKPITKAKLYAWLASRENAGRLVGEAAEAGYWRWDHEVFKKLLAFLNEM
jgi:hypothetical protein